MSASPDVRLVASDLDGTLLRTDGSVSGRTRRVVADLDRAGVPVLLVTARPMRWMGDLRRLSAHGLAVVSNGAVVMDLRGGGPLEVVGIDPAEGLELLADVRSAVPGLRIAVETPAGLVREEAYEEQDPVQEGTVVGPLSRVWTGPGLKILVRYGDPDVPVEHRDPATGERVRAAIAAAVGDRGTPTWTTEGLVEIGPPGVTKATTLARVATGLGVAAPEVIAFGDMPNDIAMLRWAGRGCAVANAHPDVRAAADEVVPGNDEDGVARTLEALLAERG